MTEKRDGINYFDPKDESVFFLSNFFLSPLEWKGRTYASVEHLYQSRKAQTFEDHKYVATASTAGQAKTRGREIPARRDWDQVKVGVMMDCLRIKFAEGTELAERLLATGDAWLCEGTFWNDRTWGVDSKTESAPGDNWLGRLLMVRRSELALQHGALV